MKRPFNPGTIEQLRYTLKEIHAVAMDYIRAGGSLAITISDTTRTLEQNALIHPIIRLWSKKVPHPVNGVMTNLNEEQWKRILVASYRGETQRMSVDLNGQVFFLDSLHTKEFSKKECSEFIEYMYAGLASRGVEFQRVVEDEPLGRTA